MELSNWAPEHSDALREFIAKGMSFSEAAQAINSRFDTSYTRSAALGRARRLGLTGDDRRKPSMPSKPAEPRFLGISQGSAALEEDPLEAVAQWITSPENKLFAREDLCECLSLLLLEISAGSAQAFQKF